jgi:hypothetical protein
VFVIATCFALYLAKGNLEWIPNWFLLVLMGLAGVYWLVSEPSVREVAVYAWQGSPSKLVHPSTHKLLKPSKNNKRAAYLIALVMTISLAIGGLLWIYREHNQSVRKVIVRRIEVLPFRLGQPVQVWIHAEHVSDPDATFYGYFQMQVNRDVMIAGGDPHEQKWIEEKFWNDFLVTTAANAPSRSTELSLPFGMETIMPEGVLFTDDDTRALINGDKSLYIAGIIRDKSGKSETPYCAVKTPHLNPGGINYCQLHN